MMDNQEPEYPEPVERIVERVRKGYVRVYRVTDIENGNGIKSEMWTLIDLYPEQEPQQKVLKQFLAGGSI